MTARLYLIGDPVAHSLSPLLHGAMIAQTGADCTYEARRVRAAELPAFLTEAKAACAGFNVTMPLKEAIVPLLDGLDASARECGAVKYWRSNGATSTSQQESFALNGRYISSRQR